jgi:exodeoxyribonuclease VII small subunit
MVKKAFQFEKSLEALEAVVESLEDGDLTLEASLKQFEQGIALSRECQKALTLAKLKVEKLIEKADGELDTSPFLDD